MRDASRFCGLSLILCVFASSVAMAQGRIQFPSATAEPPAFSGSIGPSPGPAVIGPAPSATFGGSIQAPPPQWDPYATPGVNDAPLLPQDPYLSSGIQPETYKSMVKLVQDVRLDYVWMPGASRDELGLNDIELNTTWAIPFLYNTETPLLITPGFGLQCWAGPTSVSPPTPPPDLPPRTYEAYLNSAWYPQVNAWFGGELDFRIGVYSDFSKVTDDSIRYMGKGLAVLSFSPSFKVKAGIWYLDRVKVKLLPAGGIVWTPNADTRFDILFPDPKFARRLSNWGNTEWWFTLRGEYGGDSWTIKRTSGPMAGKIDQFDYNDLRAAVGIEWINNGGLSGLFEVGIAFDRELVYRSDLPPDFRPNSTVFLHGGLTY